MLGTHAAWQPQYQNVYTAFAFEIVLLPCSENALRAPGFKEDCKPINTGTDAVEVRRVDRALSYPRVGFQTVCFAVHSDVSLVTTSSSVSRTGSTQKAPSQKHGAKSGKGKDAWLRNHRGGKLNVIKEQSGERI